MARNIVRVLPKWSDRKVTYNSIEKNVFSLKSVAIEYWKKLAQSNQPSQIVISRADWTFETEYTYGNDPFPPKG